MTLSYLIIIAFLTFWLGVYVRDCEIVDNQRKIERRACAEWGISKPKRYNPITLKEIKPEPRVTIYRDGGKVSSLKGVGE